MARATTNNSLLNHSSSPTSDTEIRPMSPSNQSAAAAAAAAAAKKKKKKGKGKRTDDSLDMLGMPPPTSNHAFSATAQAQADLIATASDLYRRIEADPQGIPDDDAYWTSLPAHLRTFIRNALPIGQLPSAAQGNHNDPNARQASTQAMIAVAQQLAQAAHASQRQLQQHPPAGANHGGVNANAYPPFPFDPSIFADLALQADQTLPLHPHPNSNARSPTSLNGTIGAGNPFAYAHHRGATLPSTQPPGEALPNAPVVLVNEYDDEVGDFDDEYYSDEELDAQEAAHGATMGAREGILSGINGQAALAAPTEAVSATKKKNKKKKKKGAGAGATAAAGQQLGDSHALPPTQLPNAPLNRLPNPPVPAPPPNAQAYAHQNVASRPTLPNTAQTPAPSSRAAGKQPMTFSSAAGKAPASGRPPVPNGLGHHPKRTASTAASSHGHGSIHGQHVDGRAWSSSNAEERERIRQYWVRLTEKERKSLIREEKEGVLKRMREQQRQGCSCAVCQRKRRMIEDELNVLYSAYYDELDVYAGHQKKHAESNGQVPAPPGPGPFPGSVALDNHGAVIGGNSLAKLTNANGKNGHVHHPPPPLGKRNTLPPEDDDGYDDEELDDEEYDDEYEYEDEEDEEDELDEPEIRSRNRRLDARGGANRSNGDMYNSYGSQATVKGILAVADDLLRNDGRKFLEMMEQLAERRAHVSSHHDVESETVTATEADEEEDELIAADEGEDAMTDDQKMEQGRRMFQIFAARMFEQRVLQAYRERIAQERQLQLLRELEEEDMAEKEKEAKRAKENQKKKDKKKQAKMQKEEERLRIENEKAAEEAAVREKLERQREAELKRQDEIRQKREAERKAKEEEKARKEEERRKRLDEERAREAEKERKKREKEEHARAEREAKEREQQKVKDAAVAAAALAKKEAEDKRLALKEAQLAAASRSTASPAPSSVPVSPASARGQAVPRSPAAAASVQQSGAGSSPQSSQHKARTTPSTSPGPNHAPFGRPLQGHPSSSSSTPRAAVAQPTNGNVRHAANGAPALGHASTPSNASTLPAPPQGLPPRPTTSVVSQPAALPASLPRPPVQASSTQAQAIVAPHASGTPSPGVNFGAIGVTKPAAVTSSQQPQGSSNVQGNGPQTQGSMPVSPDAAIGQQSSQAHVSRFGPAFGTAPSPNVVRSPTALSATASAAPSNANGFLGARQLDMGSPSGGMSSSTAAIGALSLGPSPTGGVHHAQASASNVGGGGGQPAAVLPMAIGPIGGGMSGSSAHSRAASQDDYGKMSGFGGSTAIRPVTRPAPGPIGPIGRPREMTQPYEDQSSASILPEGILGSSALGGDDELVEPQPRRNNHNAAPMAALGAGASPGPFYNTSGGSVAGSRAGAFGMSSPWAASFSGGSSTPGNAGSSIGSTLSGPVARMSSNAPNGAALMTTSGLTSPGPAHSGSRPGSSSATSSFGAIGLPQSGLQQLGAGQIPHHQQFAAGAHSLGSSVVNGGVNTSGSSGSQASGLDPWARQSNGWGRFPFDQTSPSGGSATSSIGQQQSHPSRLTHQQQQHSLMLQQQQQHGVNADHANGLNGGPSLSPFGHHANVGLHAHQQSMPMRNVFGAPGSGVPHSGGL